MNKMYEEYLKNHAYITYNKQSTYDFELSEERAKCIANKYNSLTCELQKENEELKKQLHEASLTIQELIEKDIWCPSNCEKLEKLQQENKKQKELIDEAVLELANIDGNLSNSQLSDRICNLIDILKG